MKKPILTWLILLPAILALAVGSVAFMYTHKPVRVVETGSMSPTLPVWSIVIIKEQESYQPGDMITFIADEGEPVTHRMTGTDEATGAILTKGDANVSPDNWSDPITMDDVKGKVIYTFLFSSPAVWKTPAGVMFITLLLALLVLLRPDKKKES